MILKNNLFDFNILKAVHFLLYNIKSTKWFFILNIHVNDFICIKQGLFCLDLNNTKIDQ